MTSPIGKGLTLIEVLVSIVILSTGVALVLPAFARIVHAQELAARSTQAYLFAVSKIAEVELSALQGIVPTEVEEGSFRVGQQPYVWELSAVPVAEDPQVHLVTLDVAWRFGQDHSTRNFSTLVRVPTESP